CSCAGSLLFLISVTVVVITFRRSQPDACFFEHGGICFHTHRHRMEGWRKVYTQLIRGFPIFHYAVIAEKAPFGSKFILKPSVPIVIGLIFPPVQEAEWISEGFLEFLFRDSQFVIGYFPIAMHLLHTNSDEVDVLTKLVRVQAVDRYQQFSLLVERIIQVDGSEAIGTFRHAAAKVFVESEVYRFHRCLAQVDNILSGLSLLLEVVSEVEADNAATLCRFSECRKSLCYLFKS